MDGFVKDPGSPTGWRYFASQDVANKYYAASGFKHGDWTPFDSAPADWQQATVAAGQRGKDNASAQLTQTGEVPTGRTPNAPGGNLDTSPFAYKEGGQTGFDKTSTPGTGFLPSSTGLPSSLGRDALGFLGKNWKDVLGAAATGYELYNQKNRQDKSDATTQQALDLANKQYADAAPLRDSFMQHYNSMPAQPDLSMTFSDPSNPFYRGPQHTALPQSWSPSAAPTAQPKHWDANLRQWV